MHCFKKVRRGRELINHDTPLCPPPTHRCAQCVRHICAHQPPTPTPLFYVSPSPLRPPFFTPPHPPTHTHRCAQCVRHICAHRAPPHTVTVHVPHRYALTLPLAVPIASRADVVRFRTKNGKLHMSCRCVGFEGGVSGFRGAHGMQG